MILAFEYIIERRRWPLDLLLFNFLCEARNVTAIQFGWSGYFILFHQIASRKMHLLFLFLHYSTRASLETHGSIFSLDMCCVLKLYKFVPELWVMAVLSALRR